MKRLTCLLLACLTALALTACGAEKPQEISLFAMDTYMTLAAYGDSADDALTAASREINRLEATLSRTIDTSEISQINAGGAVTVSEETASLLAQAQTYTAATDGGHSSSAAPRSSTSAGRPDTGSRRVFPVSCSAVTVCFRPQTDMVIFNSSPPP